MGTPPNIGSNQVTQLEGQITLFESALAQHVHAEAHWNRIGDDAQVDLALWRQEYAMDRLVHLRDDLQVARSL